MAKSCTNSDQGQSFAESNHQILSAHNTNEPPTVTPNYRLILMFLSMIAPATRRLAPGAASSRSMPCVGRQEGAHCDAHHMIDALLSRRGSKVEEQRLEHR